MTIHRVPSVVEVQKLFGFDFFHPEERWEELNVT